MNGTLITSKAVLPPVHALRAIFLRTKDEEKFTAYPLILKRAMGYDTL